MSIFVSLDDGILKKKGKGKVCLILKKVNYTPVKMERTKNKKIAGLGIYVRLYFKASSSDYAKKMPP